MSTSFWRTVNALNVCLYNHVGLCPEDLRKVRGAIFSAKVKWYDIGVELELPLSLLDELDKENGKDSGECLRKMLKEWLSGVSPAPSWNSLVEALSSDPVGEHILAKKIAEKYCITEDQLGSQTPDDKHAGIIIIHVYIIISQVTPTMELY